MKPESMDEFCRRWQNKCAVGMAASIGFMVSIPLAFLTVYGVGYWNWNPILSAIGLLLIPLVVAELVWLCYRQK